MLDGQPNVSDRVSSGGSAEVPFPPLVMLAPSECVVANFQTYTGRCHVRLPDGGALGSALLRNPATARLKASGTSR